jgi:hypothetical protein
MTRTWFSRNVSSRKTPWGSGEGAQMDFADQVITEGLPWSPICDLRNVTLEELARQARDGHDSIQDIVAQMTDDSHGQSSVSATTFNSAIG